MDFIGEVAMLADRCVGNLQGKSESEAGCISVTYWGPYEKRGQQTVAKLHFGHLPSTLTPLTPSIHQFAPIVQRRFHNVGGQMTLAACTAAGIKL